MPKFNFDKRFQVEVLGLVLQNYDFLTFTSDLIKPEYFDNKIYAWLFLTMRNYYQDYNTKCTDTVLFNEIKKAANLNRIKEEELEEYESTVTRMTNKVREEDYVKDEIIRFCRKQQLKKVYEETIPMASSDDDDVWDEIVKRVQSAASIGSNLNDIGIRYFEDYQERARRRVSEEDRIIVPTGITELDFYLNGGVKDRQLGMWMGGTGVGKSIVLPHCGKRAVVGGGKVVHYTLELPDDDIADRYDSSWSRVPYQELADNSLKINKRIGELGKKYGNSLIIKEFPTRQATVGTLRSHLTRVINNEFQPTLVIVDYLDLLKPSTSYNDLYADLGAITADLRGLLGEFRLPGWTATQTNRSGYASNVADVEHVSDSIQKMFVVDINISICMNNEERANKEARLFIAKNRNGPAKVEIAIKTAYDRMSFYAPAAPPVPKPVVEHNEPVKRRRRPAKKIDNTLSDPIEEPTETPKKRRRKFKTISFPMGPKIDE